MDKPKEPPKIRVVVRKRPLFGKEITRNEKDILTVVGENSLAVQEIKEKVDLTKYIEEHHFTFDNVFEHTADNQALYEECVQPLVAETFKGAKTTCFAYGQTGSGKTFTMMGTSDGSVSGMYTLASYDIIELLNQYEGLELSVSFYEIYCGKLFDLLNKRAKVECREDSRGRVQIANLTEKHVTTIEHIMDTIHTGLKSRTSGTTGANAESSRSHAILTYFIKHSGKVFSKMSFIDLAGSERGADVIDTGKKTKQDGAEINKSLLALKECIRALDQAGKAHLPFRQSKLTQVLKDSFMGNSKTTMIANVSPALSCCEPTLNTLRYADRVKELKKDPKLKALQEQGGDALSKELMLARQNNNTKIIKIDQKTGRPMSEMRELGSDFKLTKKAGLGDDPAALLAKKKSTQQPKTQPVQEEESSNVSPQKIGGGNPRGSVNSGIGGGLKRPTPAAQRQGGIGQGNNRQQPQRDNFMDDHHNNYDQEDDDDEMHRVEDIEDEAEQYQSNQRRMTQQRQIQGRPSRLNQQQQRQDPISRDEVQAAEDKLAEMDLKLDSLDNNLLLDDDPFASEVQEQQRPSTTKRQPNKAPRQQQQPEYDDEQDFDEEQHQEDDYGEEVQRNAGRRNKRNDGMRQSQQYSKTSKNLNDGLTALQNRREGNNRNNGNRNQTQNIEMGDDDDIIERQEMNQRSQPRRGRRQQMEQEEYDDQEDDDQFEMEQVDVPSDPQPMKGHRRNQSGNVGGIGGGANQPGFRSRLKAPTSGGLKQPTLNNQTSQASSNQSAPDSKKSSVMQGFKNSVNSFKERLKNQKSSRDQPMNPREAMRNSDNKKVLFGSMIDTISGGDNGENFLARSGIERQPRGALKQPTSSGKTRGMSQAPSLSGQKKLENEGKTGTASKLLQSRQNRYQQQQQDQSKKAAPKKEKLGDGIPTFDQLNVKYANNIEQLAEDHEKVIEQILEEEEQLIFKHNTSCKQSIKIVEEEMAILKNVDKPGSDVENYVEQLDKILVRKIEMMVDLRRHVLDFYKNIKTEEILAKLYQQMQESQEDYNYDDDYMNQYGRPNM